MDFITTGIIASTAYDLLKMGLKLTAKTIKDRLGTWIKDDVIAVAVSEELTKLGISDEMSEKSIERHLEQSVEISRLIQTINASSAVVAPSAITSVSQVHSGSGDNVAGNKISA
ncbi:hypothetical protein [Comamonas sp. AG1104]|uniref:GapS6a family protein n=1 Tax=Comamonas sp. AG1104 TaxID=2183900 RepID=UPI000E0A0789|nr:hypothetical protein [Comamonas sp. AG1104]RDI10768.1 hypothetical protein DFO48_105281 [Comamonas sp. AG1104]